MALALVEHPFGKDYAQAVMLDLEYDPKPPIEGGSVHNTVPVIERLMREMYDFFLLNFVNCPNDVPDACLFG